MTVESERLGAVVSAVARAHSYETPAIDVYPLKAQPVQGHVGRIGRLKKPKTLAQLADEVKESLGLQAIRVAGESDHRVEQVAVVPGCGSGFVEMVYASACQAYVTGELRDHEAGRLASRGIGAILAGHYETERTALDAWVPRLVEALDVEVRPSQAERPLLRAQ